MSKFKVGDKVVCKLSRGGRYFVEAMEYLYNQGGILVVDRVRDSRDFKVGDKVVCILKERPDYFNYQGKMDMLLNGGEIMTITDIYSDCIYYNLRGESTGYTVEICDIKRYGDTLQGKLFNFIEEGG